MGAIDAGNLVAEVGRVGRFPGGGRGGRLPSDGRVGRLALVGFIVRAATGMAVAGM